MLLSLLNPHEELKQERGIEVNLSYCPLVRTRCDASLLKFGRICLSCIHHFTLNQKDQQRFCTAKSQVLSLYHACRGMKTQHVGICNGKAGNWPSHLHFSLQSAGEYYLWFPLASAGSGRRWRMSAQALAVPNWKSVLPRVQHHLHHHSNYGVWEWAHKSSGICTTTRQRISSNAR